MVTSASTFIITRCLPCSIAMRSKSAATPGLPVASMTTSISGVVTSVSAEVMAILPMPIAALTCSTVSASRPMALVAIGDGHGLERGVGAAGGDGGDPDARHQRALGDEIGAHLARADDADADGFAGLFARREVAGKAGQVDVGSHGAHGLAPSRRHWNHPAGTCPRTSPLQACPARATEPMPEPQSPQIETAVEGRLGVITLNRPKAINALNREMIGAIRAQLAAWRGDDGGARGPVRGARATRGFAPAAMCGRCARRCSPGGRRRRTPSLPTNTR